MMSKFTRSWALKGYNRDATENTPVASNVDGGGGGLLPSANRPTYGQQQNEVGEQQLSKPRTALTASMKASHGVDTTFNNQILLTNTATKAGEKTNLSSYGGDGNGSYPSAAPGPCDNQQSRTKHTTESAERPERINSRGYPPLQKEEKRPEMKSEHHRSAEKDNESEVKDHDNNQMIQSPSMSTQSQRGKVLPRSKTEERTSVPANPPASGSPQGSTPQGGLEGTVVAYIVVPNNQVPWGPHPPYKELQSQDASKESKTRDDKAQGGTTVGVQRAASKPRDEIRQTNIQTNGTDSQQQTSGFDGMGARRVGNPAPNTSIPAPNEPSRVSMPSQKQNSRRLGVLESNEPYTYNKYPTFSVNAAS